MVGWLTRNLVDRLHLSMLARLINDFNLRVLGKRDRDN